jgi:selenide,water dikinase
MGARPVTALAIAGFPDGAVDVDTVRQIFLGGLDKLREAGVALLGGHTVRDPEVKFGYAVTGAVEPGEIWSNAGARPDDVLILTKPLGTGIIGTAIKFDRAPDASVAAAVRSMIALNAVAATVLARFPGHVHACTDITGFGLIGHSTEIARASNVTLELRAHDLPLIDGVFALASRNRSGGMGSNREHFEAGLAAHGIDPVFLDVCFDPQTSGGLLASVAPGVADAAIASLLAAGVPARAIGLVHSAGTTPVVLRN